MFRATLFFALLVVLCVNKTNAVEILASDRYTIASSFVDDTVEDGPNFEVAPNPTGFWKGSAESSAVFGNNTGYGFATQESTISLASISGTLNAMASVARDDANQTFGDARSRLLVDFNITESMDFRLTGWLDGEDGFNNQGIDSFIDFSGDDEGEIFYMQTDPGQLKSFDVTGTLSPGFHRLVVDVSVFTWIINDDQSPDSAWTAAMFELTFIPSPGAMWLLGAGVFVDRRRRR